MKKSRLLFRINLGVVIFLGTGWFYFYWLILTKHISGMPHAMTVNHVITALNLIFIVSLCLLPISYRKRK